MLAVLHANIARLSKALQLPCMAAASAACADPDAVAALCILAMAGPTSFEDQPDFPPLMLQPAVADCLRCVSCQRAGPDAHVCRLHCTHCICGLWHLSNVAMLSGASQHDARKLHRFAAAGRCAPLLSAAETAQNAARLAAACCSSGKLADETYLVQLLHICSTALSANIVATACTVPQATTSGRQRQGWQSDWMHAVATAMQVRPCHSHLIWPAAHSRFTSAHVPLSGTLKVLKDHDRVGSRCSTRSRHM